MRPRVPIVSVLFLLFALQVPAASSKPNEREWSALSAEAARIEQLRRTAPVPPAGSSRKDQLAVVLDNQKKLEPVYLEYLQKLEEYYVRTGDPRAARAWANEKIRIGDDYMYLLSRYDRAIAMYQSALAIDPANVGATERIAAAEARRFVSMDAFAAIRTGMKEEEVRQRVGMPREDWIKQVVQKSRVFSVWIYPKKDGGASAIYFDNGVVYHTNWNAAPAADR